MTLNAAVLKNTSKWFTQNLIATSLLVTSCLVTPTVIANEKAEVDNYTIEVVVFQSRATKGWTEELWPNEIELPNTTNSVDLDRPGKAPLWIQDRNTKLTSVVGKMQRDYRILFHKAWTQNSFTPAKTPAILIDRSYKDLTNITGTVQLYKTRFAHVKFDLEFERMIPESIREAFAYNQMVNIEDLPTYWRFKLAEQRKIKPGELHYIDHPLFGILVKIKKN